LNNKTSQSHESVRSLHHASQASGFASVDSLSSEDDEIDWGSCSNFKFLKLYLGRMVN
jgi:hypothetical protein